MILHICAHIFEKFIKSRKLILDIKMIIWKPRVKQKAYDQCFLNNTRYLYIPNISLIAEGFLSY